MAKGDPLSSSQQKIVNRYYDNIDTIALARVQELVGEIYLVEPGAKKEKLWRQVEGHLKKLKVPAPQLERVMDEQDVKLLAQLVSAITGTKPGASVAVPIKAAIAPAPLKPAAPAPAPAAQVADAPGTTGASASSASPAAPVMQGAAFTEEDLKMAMKAFKKRLKLTKLDEESKLGRNPLSTGKGSGIFAISPPRDYSIQVWEELVKRGRLKPAGKGFYQLVGE
jgi:hypothetical protein